MREKKSYLSHFRNSVVTAFLILGLICLYISGCSEKTKTNDVDVNTGIGAVNVDVDLSVLSSTMAQAEFFNILSNSSNYFGKTIRAKGVYYNECLNADGPFYHYVTIVYGDACCRMGFEFKLTDDYVFPKDYPAQNSMVDVVGVFDKYEESGHWYSYLAVDKIRF